MYLLGRHWLTIKGDNNLSFIETSALDASNVELAFQNILTGIDGYLIDLMTATKGLQKYTALSPAKPSITATPPRIQ